MSPTAIAELESELESITGMSAWAPSLDAGDHSELSVESRMGIPIKSDFATMGGSRPRKQM